MSTLKDVKEFAKHLGAKIEDDKCGDTHECRVEAPHRQRWQCCAVHELVDSAYRPWKPDYADIICRMAYGLEDCTDPDCDWCES